MTDRDELLTRADHRLRFVDDPFLSADERLIRDLQAALAAQADPLREAEKWKDRAFERRRRFMDVALYIKEARRLAWKWHEAGAVARKSIAQELVEFLLAEPESAADPAAPQEDAPQHCETCLGHGGWYDASSQWEICCRCDGRGIVVGPAAPQENM